MKLYVYGETMTYSLGETRVGKNDVSPGHLIVDRVLYGRTSFNPFSCRASSVRQD